MRLAVVGDRLQLEVRDDGCGFDVERGESSRAQALSGRLSVESRRGEGTIIRLECPLQRRPDASAA